MNKNVGGGGGWEGMTADIVENQARQLAHLADQAQQLVHKIDGEVARLADNWHGDDSRKFRSEWDGQYKHSLIQASKILDTMSQHALAQAAEQRRSSHN